LGARLITRVPSSEPPRGSAWESIAISIVASKGIREWWDAESGGLAFMPKIRSLIDHKLDDKIDPPIPLSKRWAIFSAEAWYSSTSNLEGKPGIQFQAPAAHQADETDVD
jgi:hypothetical protein